MKQQELKKRAMQFISLLSAAALFLSAQNTTVFAETISGNAGTEVGEQGSGKEEKKEGNSRHVIEDESTKEDEIAQTDTEQAVDGSSQERETISGSNVSENDVRTGKGDPANPVHHCTKKNDGSDYTDFSYVYFGNYPQSEVTDSATIAAINNAIGMLGTEADAGTDVWVNGIKYRRISKNDTDYSGYFGDSTYRYFKWERIKWRVLKNNGNTLFVVADKAIDSSSYNEERKSLTWENSAIRNWLSNSFYNTAFSSKEQAAIVSQTVVNENNPEYGTEAGNNTNDRVYLLSIGEATNKEYGFCDDESVYSASRWVKVSNYARARGTYTYNDATTGGNDNCWWWLRSPGSTSSYAAYVYGYGCGDWIGGYVDGKRYGICPALHINLSSGIWFVTDDGTSGEGGDEKTADPAASIPTGSSVKKNTKLSLSSATVGANIYYTTDGTTPTIQSILYTGNIILDRDMTIKAVAVCRGCRISDMAEFSYKVQGGDSGKNNSKNNNEKENDNKDSNNKNNRKVQKLTIKAPSKKLAAGKKVKLTLNITPKNATNKAVKWKSSNKKYATVDENGRIELKKKGIGKQVTIQAVAQDGSGQIATIKIKIMKHAVKSIKLKSPKKTLKAGKTMTIKTTVNTTGKNANKSLKWKSSNKKYATVNSKGKVTAKKAGKGKKVTITAASTDGSNKKAKIKIQIK